jgi:lipopolysaccharide export system permease protein
MRILDRYIIRELLVPIIFCTFALIFLILIADLFDNMDDMIRNNTKFSHILQYYLAFLPVSFTHIISWACLLGTVYLLIHFNHHSEVLAMKAAGLNISTIVRPILFVGFMIGIVAFIISDKVTPKTHLIVDNIRTTKIEKKDDGVLRSQIFQDVTYSTRDGRLYYIENYNPSNATMDNLVLIFLDQAKNIKRRITAESASYKNGVWTLEQIMSYETDPSGKIVGEPDHIVKKEYPEILETPRDFKEAAAEGDFLSYQELKGHIAKLEESGITASSEKTDLQAKLATPWQSLIMILVAILFLSKTTQRKAVAMNVLVCLLVIFIYYVTNAIFMALGKSGAIPPFISAWAANFIFAAGCIFFFEKGNE